MNWRTVAVPSSFEDHEGVQFDGVGIYRKRLAAIELPDAARAILHFQAVATECEVRLDGQRVGTHLGGWTPFRIDITEQMRSRKSDQPHELMVRVDEKVGHNSQGFLPIVAPHFGGMWQDVQLLIVPACWIDDRQLLAVGDPASGSIRLEIPLHNRPLASGAAIDVRYRLLGSQDWSPVRTVRLDDQTRVASDTLPAEATAHDQVERHSVMHSCCRLEMVVARVAILCTRWRSCCATFRRVRRRPAIASRPALGFGPCRWMAAGCC